MPKIKSTNGGTWVFSTGSYRRIGIATQTLKKQLADYFGVSEGLLVTSFNENSPAAKAGLKAGDIITKVGDYTISSMESYMQTLGKFQKGDKAKVKYKRGNDMAETEVQF